MKRSGKLRQRPKRRSVEEKNASEWWGIGSLLPGQAIPRKSVTESDTWAILSPQRHHPVPRSICRKNGAPEWDPRNRVLVTRRRHERHHSGHETLHASELPPSVREFATEFGLLPWCERHIPGWV